MQKQHDTMWHHPNLLFLTQRTPKQYFPIQSPVLSAIKKQPCIPGMIIVLGAITCPAPGNLLIAVKPKG